MDGATICGVRWCTTMPAFEYYAAAVALVDINSRRLELGCQRLFFFQQ